MFTFPSTDGVEIHVSVWEPDGEARGIVQIAHGVGEHAERYAHFAETLTAHGYVVYANDHRGHGRTLKGAPGDLGDDGWNLLVADMAALSEKAKERHPGRPLVLLGHSLGSFAAQQYVLDQADLLAGLILSGTTAVDGLLERMLAVLAEDPEADPMAAFNRPFEPGRTGFEWLSRDEAQVDAYVADPLCGFGLDDRATGDLFTAAVRLAEPAGIPADLPVYIVVGTEDPLNVGLELSDRLVERYRNAGLTDVTYRKYQDARHEVLNELNRDEVERDLVTWIDRVTG
ncbi:alpha/beta hydrolase [Actinomadura rayongensis]|uniref:Alpha/beta fold hydrolase n=1 Tax=Actinomadura rayongensis TaxID=1429076 RepID=A0A6I4WNP4_9ACTN|nr:alpha/beta hydrolase [Actinomadura rayongensis]MXQ68252.1 alpha/beta fold hydrolase [Actinomadura rayongensis]